MSGTYSVTWRVTVEAKDAMEAAERARARMIDPSNTTATFEVRRVPLGQATVPETVVVQDPDRSDE